MTDTFATVFLEWNCDESYDASSVWLLARRYDADAQEYEFVSEIPGIEKCIGPVKRPVALQVAESIERLLRALGVTFEFVEVADD
jgi:hypothetical protein